MNYGLFYKQINLNRNAIATIQKAISSTDFKWQQATLHERKETSPSIRVSDIAWIRDENLLSMLLRIAKNINRISNWNLNISGVEPVQFGSYREGGFYDWHIDQHPKVINNMVRKISMTIFLNDDYEGGEFDLEIYKPGDTQRFVTIKPKKYSAVFFLADDWHRVRPVTAGHRKSLVAWFYGPPYV